MDLPEKKIIETWRHELVICRLMQQNVWSQLVAEQYFVDFMKWMYTNIRSQIKNNKKLNMHDDISNLDEVWHNYLQYSEDYFTMSKTLFNTDYIHHLPQKPFEDNILAKEEVNYQLTMLLEDWGENYIKRTYAYTLDKRNILSTGFQSQIKYVT